MVLNGGYEIILANLPNDKHILCKIGMEASHPVCHILSWIILFNRINFDAWRQAFVWHQARLSQV